MKKETKVILSLAMLMCAMNAIAEPSVLDETLTTEDGRLFFSADILERWGFPVTEAEKDRVREESPRVMDDPLMDGTFQAKPKMIAFDGYPTKTERVLQGIAACAAAYGVYSGGKSIGLWGGDDDGSSQPSGDNTYIINNGTINAPVSVNGSGSGKNSNDNKPEEPE